MTTNTPAPERGEPQWTVLDRVSPSGKRLFWCQRCGRVSQTPDKTCPDGCGQPAAPREVDGAHRYDQVLDVLDHYTPAERAEAFYLMESRYCWDCGQPPADCQCAVPPADALRVAAEALRVAVRAHDENKDPLGLGLTIDRMADASAALLRAALDASERADGAA